MAATAATLPQTIVDEDEVPERRIPMTYAEYEAWTGREEQNRGEWVDGEVIVFVSVTPRHALIVAFLLNIFGIYLDLRRTGLVFAPDAELRTREGAARQPDITVVLNEHRDRVTDHRILRAADLVVEVVSPESVRRDRDVKRAEYAAVGVPEYWLIDPRPGRNTAQLFVLGPDGAYVTVSPDAHGRLASRVLPGVWLDPAWLIAEELPSVVRLGAAMAEAGDAAERQ